MNERLSTVEEFLQRNRISKPTLYKLFREGKGPRVIRVGRRVFIAPEAEAEWRRSMEADGNADAA